jgi:2-succinyl-5-enolpyruvyl-6-hydroxy-3-cyclohexene-1-carboxylate synthase
VSAAAHSAQAAQTALARTLVDEWVRHGLADAVVAPGSRNTPLTLALAGHGGVRVHVVVDERCAGFFAIGLARASGRAVLVSCTSGSAPSHLHPAVLEAYHGRVPLLVCTADRPWDLHHVGAPQTVDQHGLYGTAVRFAVDLPTASWEAAGAWRPTAARTYAAAAGPPAGPVHVNVAFAEPLLPPAGEVPEVPGRPDGRPWTTTAGPPARSAAPGVSSEPVERSSAERRVRGLVVAGWGAEVDPALVAATGWPVLADPLSGLRAGPATVSTYDALLRVPDWADAHRPDVVVRVGAPLTSKVTGQWLDGLAACTVLVDPHGEWRDPGRAASERVTSWPDLPPSDPDWAAAWARAEATARRAVDDLLDGWDEPFEGRVARDVAAVIPDGGTLVVASSMPVRDVEWFAAPRSGLRVVANRGVNGIDGFTSTVLGLASARADDGRGSAPAVGLLGDLAFVHDAGGLVGASGRDVTAVLVVLDNGGGGIFSFLPQADLDPAVFERFWATPSGVDVAALAGAHGIPVQRVGRSGDVGPAVVGALADGGVRVVVVGTDRADNVVRHRAVWEAVAAAVRASFGPGAGPAG